MLRVTDTLSLSQVDDRPSCITHTHTHTHIQHSMWSRYVSGHKPNNEPESHYVTLAGAHDMPINGSRRQSTGRCLVVPTVDD